MDCFSSPPGEADVAPPPVWPSRDTAPTPTPPILLCLRSQQSLRLAAIPWRNTNSEWQDAASRRRRPSPSPRCGQHYTTPRGGADLSFISDTLPTGRLQLNSNGECHRSLESWVLRWTVKYSKLWKSSDFFSVFSCSWVVAECVSESIFCSPSVLSDVTEQKLQWKQRCRTKFQIFT